MIRLNDDINIVNLIKQGIKENDGYCPCMLEKTEATKCMCDAFRNQKEGVCHCGLYIKTLN